MKLITLLVLSFTLGLKPRPANLEPKLTQRVSVKANIEQNQIFFKGIPSYTPFTITNSQNESIQIPEWNILQTSIPVSIELTDPNGKKYSSTVNHFAFISSELETNRGPRPVFKKKLTFDPNENRRCFGNIGPAIEKLNVPAGEYRMRICVWEDIDKIAGSSEEQMIQIVDISADDNQWLSESLEISPGGIEKINQVITPSDIKAIPSKGIREQLAFNVILITLASQKNLKETQIEGFQNLVAPYLLPEIDLFQYEILLAKQEKDRAAQIQKELIQKFPSMAYWLKQAENGQGYINRLKSMRINSIEMYVGLIDPNIPR